MDEVVNNKLALSNLCDGKWWRLFNLKGMRLKLIRPISEFSHPGWKGDRNYIIIHSYVADDKIYHYNMLVDMLNIRDIPTYTYSDKVIYKNELTEHSTKHMIDLSLLDYDYFYNLLTNVQDERRIKGITENVGCRSRR